MITGIDTAARITAAQAGKIKAAGRRIGDLERKEN